MTTARQALDRLDSTLTDAHAQAEAAVTAAETRADNLAKELAAAQHQIGILDALDAGRAHGARRIMNERDQAKQDADRFKADHLAACKTIADMHEAATGRTSMAPIRGVVEDVADMRTHADIWKRIARDADAAREQAQQDAQQAEKRAHDAEEALSVLRGVTDTDRAEKAEAERDELHAALGLAPGQLHSAALSAIRGRGVNIRELIDRAEKAERRATLLDQELNRRNVYTPNDAAEDRIRSLTHQVAELRRCNTQQAETIRDMGKQVKAAKETARVSTVAALNLQRQTPDAAQHTLDRIRNASTALEAWVTLGMYYGMPPEQTGQRSRAWRTTAELAAKTRGDGWRKHALDADARADRFEAAWQNARLRAKQAKAREDRANERAERHRATREQWVNLANAATEKACDRARQAGKRAATAEAAIDRVRALLGTHLGPLATIAVRRALDITEG